MTDPEVERIAALAWRTFSELAWSWPGDATLPDRWRDVARAVIADRAAQPPVTDGPTLMEVVRERDAARRREKEAVAENGRLRTEIALSKPHAPCVPVVQYQCVVALGDKARAERDALQRRLDALAAREPTETDIWKMSDTLQNPARGFVALWRCVRDALLTAQEHGEEGHTDAQASSSAEVDLRAPAPAPTNPDPTFDDCTEPGCEKCAANRAESPPTVERTEAKDVPENICLYYATETLHRSEKLGCDVRIPREEARALLAELARLRTINVTECELTAAREREDIVEWLRGTTPDDVPCRTDAAAYHRAADAIEHGEHHAG